MSTASSFGVSLLVLLIILGIAEKTAAIRSFSVQKTATAGARPIHTIFSQDGDIIDCIDIYDQPALKNPLLKDHTIKMKPTKYQKDENFIDLQQTWHKSGNCPTRTIPILRHVIGTNVTEPVFFRPSVNFHELNFRQEDASAYEVSRRPYYGTQARLFSYSSPVVAHPDEFSISYVAVGARINSADDPGRRLEYPDTVSNVVAAGYMVHPNVNSDQNPRTFIYYNNPTSGCFNLQCGFVQTNFRFALGATVPETTASYDALYVEIEKDDVDGSWWVSFNGQLIGYYPSAVFEGFENANVVQWGGLVYNKLTDEVHTATTMGSGVVSTSSGADVIGDIRVYTQAGIELVTQPDGVNTPYPGCYDYSLRPDLISQQPGNGFYFAYGGPGGPHCDG